MGRPPKMSQTLRRLKWISDNHDPFSLYMCIMVLLDCQGDRAGLERLNVVYAEVAVVPDPVSAKALMRMFGQHDHRIKMRLLGFAEETLPTRHPANRYLPWLALQIQRNRYDLGSIFEIVARFSTIASWADHQRPDLYRHDARSATDLANAWAQERALANMIPGELVYTFDDEWTVQELSRPAQFQAEGWAMQHCLSEPHHAPPPRTVVYSIRDPRGHPHLTMAHIPTQARVLQIRGKQNTWPRPAYLARAIEFRLEGLRDQPRYPSIAPTTRVVDDRDLVFAAAYHRPASLFSAFPFLTSEFHVFWTRIWRDFGLVLSDTAPAGAARKALFPTLSIYQGAPGLSWRVFLDHRIFLLQSVGALFLAHQGPMTMWGTNVEDEMVAAIAALDETQRRRMLDPLSDLLDDASQ